MKHGLTFGSYLTDRRMANTRRLLDSYVRCIIVGKRNNASEVFLGDNTLKVYVYSK